MKEILNYLHQGNLLSKNQANDLIRQIAQGRYNDVQISSLLSVYMIRSISVDELIGFRQGLLDLSLEVDFSEFDRIDIVGTGGDAKNSFNISTLSCMVVAGAGYKVSKHGNFAASSISGSSNVLEALGYIFTSDSDKLKRQLDRANICFLHAPLFHPALKTVANVRKQLGLRTIFNLLGPLVNPSRPQHQLLGVSDSQIAEVYAKCLSQIGINYSIVHSLDGYDEVSLTSDVLYYRNGERKILKTDDFALGKFKEEDLYSGPGIDDSMRIFLSVLKGESTLAQKNVVLANSALALATIAQCDYQSALEMARESLESKRAFGALKKLLG